MDSAPLRRMARRQALEVRLVAQARAHNLAILLSGVHMSWAALKQGLLAMSLPGLSLEQLRGLAKFAVPSPEEQEALEAYLQGRHPEYPGQSELTALGHAERFFAQVSLQVPRLAQRLTSLAFMASLPSSVQELQALTQLVIQPCQQLRDSAAFTQLLRQVLIIGNHLNMGTAKGAALGFKLESLLRLADIKSGPLPPAPPSLATSRRTQPASSAASAPSPSTSASSSWQSALSASTAGQPAQSAAPAFGPSLAKPAASSASEAGAGAGQRTSLLQYVVRTALRSSPALLHLPEQLAGLKAASNVQVRVAEVG
ncbi:formin homology 2 domain-containing protein [Haematococcus lacustris]